MNPVTNGGGVMNSTLVLASFGRSAKEAGIAKAPTQQEPQKLHVAVL